MPDAYTRGGMPYQPPGDSGYGQPPPDFQQAQPPPQYPGGSGAVHGRAEPQPQLDCGEVDGMMLLFNFGAVLLTSYVGMAYVTRPQVTGNRFVDCFENQCLPRGHTDDVLTKSAAGIALIIQWGLALFALTLVLIPITFYGVLGVGAAETGHAGQDPANAGPFVAWTFLILVVSPLLLIPLAVLNVMGGMYFLWYFWTHGKNFSVIPIWIYISVCPSLVAWIIAGVLGLLILLEGQGYNIWGYNRGEMSHGGTPAAQQYASYH